VRRGMPGQVNRAEESFTKDRKEFRGGEQSNGPRDGSRGLFEA